MFHTVIFVALGGALGSVARYLLVLMLGTPLGTALVNILGSVIIGALFVLLAGSKGAAPMAPFLMTGLLGGFTTFSAFSLDALRLVEAGHVGQAGLYVLGSVGLSLIGVTLGATLVRGLLT